MQPGKLAAIPNKNRTGPGAGTPGPAEEMMTTASKPLDILRPENVFRNHRKNLISWDADDPATPALILPMLDSEYGLDEITDPVERESIISTIEYCIFNINLYMNDFQEPYSMGEMAIEAQEFRNGWMSARTGKVKRY